VPERNPVSARRRSDGYVDVAVTPDHAADTRVRLLGTCPPATAGLKTLSQFGGGFAVFEDGAYLDELICTATDCNGTVPPGGTISPALPTSASPQLPTATIPGCTTRALRVQTVSISDDVTVGAMWTEGAEMDLSAYQGIALTVAGNAPGVVFDVDTACAPDAGAPSSCSHFYSTTFDTQATWTEVHIPWSEFREDGQRGLALAPIDKTLINGFWFWLPRQDTDISIAAIGVY
jgi:hypothetical protein